MKNLVFGIIATVFFGSVGNAQTKQSDWKTMMSNFDLSVNKVLIRECPKGMKMEDFKIAIVNGTVNLSETAKREILKFTEPMKLYSREFMEKHLIQTTDDAETLFLAGLSPELPINDGQLQINGTPGLTSAEIGNCAIAATGVNLIWSLGASTATTWSVAAITKAFTKVASRFLGPVGVAITVAAFAFCLADQYAD